MYFIDNSDTEVEFDDSLLLSNESSLSKNTEKNQNSKEESLKISQEVEENKFESNQAPKSSDLVVRTMVEMISTKMKIKTKEEFKNIFTISKRIDYNSHNEEGLIKIKYDGESLGRCKRYI